MFACAVSERNQPLSRDRRLIVKEKVEAAKQSSFDPDILLAWHAYLQMHEFDLCPNTRQSKQYEKYNDKSFEKQTQVKVTDLFLPQRMINRKNRYEIPRGNTTSKKREKI